jgi:hypothetical protein
MSPGSQITKSVVHPFYSFVKALGMHGAMDISIESKNPAPVKQESH